VNHLGNGRNNQAHSFNWTLPTLDATAKDGVGAYTKIGTATADNVPMAKCIVRMRYNISTDDYDPRNTFADQNENKNKGIRSPVEENPTVDVGANLQGLRLAINTAQFGRTFQDRSHTFYIKARGGVGDGPIVNLNVRGKRGNIVQTFPSVEYDFTPNMMEIDQGTMVHLQWTGSNTHNNGNPAGDGQAGDAGEGKGGTDRHNLAGLKDRASNYPLAMDADEYKDTNIFKQFTCKDPITKTVVPENDCAMRLATSNYYKTVGEANADTDNFNPLLNDAPASLVGGILLQPKAAAKGKQFHYMCTRNNNFSNRSQKGTITVNP